MTSTLPNLLVTISKTADGSADYMQIISEDQFALNIVLIAGKIEVADRRPPEQAPQDKVKSTLAQIKPKRGRK